MIFLCLTQSYTRERITITDSVFKIDKSLDVANGSAEDSGGHIANEAPDMEEDCCFRQVISDNRAELERAEVRTHCLLLSVIVALFCRSWHGVTAIWE